MVEFSSGLIRGLGTVVVAVAFIDLALWVFSPRLKPRPSVAPLFSLSLLSRHSGLSS